MQSNKDILASIVGLIIITTNLLYAQTSNNINLIGRWAHGPCEAIAVEGNYAFIGNGSTFQVLDISDLTNPYSVGEINLPERIKAIATQGEYVFVANGNSGLHIIDISNPSSPVELANYDTPGFATDVIVEGNYVYVADGESGLRIININSLSSPWEEGYWDTPGYANGVCLYGNYVFVADGEEGVSTVIISDPANPVGHSGYMIYPSNVKNVFVEGNYAYACGGEMQIYDISDPIDPWFEGNYSSPGSAEDVFVFGEYAFLADGGSGLRIINISNPLNPVEEAFYDTQGNVSEIWYNSNYAFLADGNSGLRILKISDFSNIMEEGTVNTPGFAIDVVVEGNYAYVADRGAGLRIINISDHSNPVEEGFWDTPGVAEGVSVRENYAYIADGGSGLRIINISNPSNATEEGFWDTPGTAYSVIVEGNYAYVADGPGGLRIINISDPSNPVEEAYYNSIRAHRVKVKDSLAYIIDNAYNINATDLHILDISNIQDIWEVGYYFTPSIAYDLDIQGSFLYISEEEWGGVIPSTLRIINISNPSAPYQVGFHYINGFGAGLIARGNYVYQMDGNGVQIINITDPSNPYQEQYFRTRWNGMAKDVAANEGYLYIADGDSGISIINISRPTNTTEVGFYETPGLFNRLSVSGPYCYIVGDGSGLQIINISDISNPIKEASIDTFTSIKDVAISDSNAYLTDFNSGLSIINISNPQNPFQVGNYYLGSHMYPLSVEIKNDFAYMTWFEFMGNGLEIINISNPSSPYLVSIFGIPNAGVSEISLSNDYAFILIAGGFEIINIFDPYNPYQVNQWPGPPNSYEIDVCGNYAFLAWGSFGLRIINISNPGNLFEEGYYITPGNASNIAVKGNYAYVADSDSGLRILNVSDPGYPFEEGYYKTKDKVVDVKLSNPYICLIDQQNGLYILQESIPPSQPDSLRVNFNNPNLWQNDPVFQIVWNNPNDMTGIASAKYKIGDPPSGNGDYHGILGYLPPQNVNVFEEGEQTLYVWLVDSAGNEDYNNYASTVVRYDSSISSPYNFQESHGILSDVWQDSIDNPTFTWTAPQDTSGIEVYYLYFGTNASGDTAIDSTSNTSFSFSALEGVSYFRITPKDSAGNIGDWTTGFIFKYDNTHPSNPDSIIELGGVSNNTWQNNVSVPNFNWYGASDNLSGVNKYWIYWGTNANGNPTIERTLPSYNAPISINNIYYLRIKTEDNAGNQSFPSTIYIFKHDGTYPINPDSVFDITGNSQNNIWQNTSNNPDFTWNTGIDSLSGISGYFYYWGVNPLGTSTSFTNITGYNPAIVDTGINYLRIQTQDSVNNLAPWETSYIFKYDNIKPDSAIAYSPDTSAFLNFTVSWSGASDKGGSGLTGRYNVMAKDGTGSWSPWLTNYSGTNADTIGQQYHTYYFEAAAIDSAGNIEILTGTPECSTVVDTFAQDTLAPASPINLTANGSSPSPWRNISLFQVDWINPNDMTGISGAYYKLSSPPDSVNDTTATVTGMPPTNVNATQEGGQDLYVWLKDGNRNINHLNYSVVKLRYDQTKPEGSVASSPDSTRNENFTVTWSAGIDSGGSGLTNHYDVNIKVGTGNWNTWKTNFPGNQADTVGEQGETYYFEASARDSAGNIEDFTYEPECSTYIKPNIEIAISPIINEQSNIIRIDYTIINPDSFTTGIRCKYLTQPNSIWKNATTVGDTTGIIPANYTGFILWDSFNDEPGCDFDSVQFKITPYDNNGLGIANNTNHFHLDNNQPPSAVLKDLPDEVSHTIQFQSTLSDFETDTLSIKCSYKIAGNTIWEKPTLISDTTGLIPGANQIPIIWDSDQNIPYYSGYVWFKVIPKDNDYGIADSTWIFVDNLGIPVITFLTQPIDEQSGDIVFEYIIQDDEYDFINLNAQYSLDSLIWFDASVSGDTINISPQNYHGGLLWHSDQNLPGIDKEQVWFKITPNDANIGISIVTHAFHLDNNQLPILSINIVGSPTSGIVKIPFLIQDEENDTINILTSYREGTSAWQTIGETQYIPSNYLDTLEWNTGSELGFGQFNNLAIQFVPLDHDTGVTQISNQFDVYNYAGDYSGDITIDNDDLIQFALGWGNQDLSKEIGPATGQPPLLIPQPDGVIDFEDLMVLVQQWNWSYDNPGMLLKISISDTGSGVLLNKPAEIKFFHIVNEVMWEKKSQNLEFNKLGPTQNSHLFNIEQSLYYPWSNEFGDEIFISIDTTAKILGLQLQVNYDFEVFTFSEIENILLSAQNGFTFKQVDEANGRMVLNTIVLNNVQNISELDGELFKFKIDAKKEMETSINFSWQIHNESGDLISRGQEDFSLKVHNIIPKEYALYQNFPNPFNPSTTIRYQLPVNGKVNLDIYNILGQKVITLINDNQSAGYYQKTWSIMNQNSQAASGLYFIRLMVQGKDGSRFVKNKKMLLVK
jgi:hypothetical protein